MIIASQVVNLSCGHIAGIPFEETLASIGPVLLVAVGAALATLRARLRRVGHARAERDLDDRRDRVVGAHSQR